MMLGEERKKSYLCTNPASENVNKTIYLKETDSTNDWLKGYQPEAGEDMTVVTTD